MSDGTSPKKLKQSTLDELFARKSSLKKSPITQNPETESEYQTHKSASSSQKSNTMKCSSQDEEKLHQLEKPILCHSPKKMSLQPNATGCSKDLPENANCVQSSLDTCSELDEDFSPAPSLPTMASQGDSDLNSQASIMTTDEENNIELQTSCFPLEKMHRAPTCWSKEEELASSDKDHSVMFTLPFDYDSEGDVLPKPSPTNYIDSWGDNHVKMPCSIHNDYVDGKLKQRWELIELALRSVMKSSRDMENAILSYNLRYKGVWKFETLHQLFVKMDESEYEEFFAKQLPAMVKLALQLPYICTLPIPLLKKNTNKSITFSQEQVACLLANAFFCTFPRRNTYKRNSEYSNYPSINFTSLYQNVNPRTLEKLKCILHYFRRVTNKMPNGTVTFQRQCLKDFPNWVTTQTTLSKLYCSANGTIEDTGPGFLEVDFANKRIGGGVLRSGCVQEEIRFVICPELLLSRLFTEVLENNECLIIKGFERFSNYSGYASSFMWKGDYQDKAVKNSWGRRVSQLTCIDASVVSNYANQFERWHIQRELCKAYCGFYDKSEKSEDNLPAVCTGNWGCGAFGGDHRLKALIQLMAASEAHRDVCYFTFKDKTLEKDICRIHKFLVSHSISICQLMNLIDQYRRDILYHKPLCTDRINLFDYIYQQCGVD